MTTKSADPEKLRERILLAALPHVPFDGWTTVALQAGAADAGLDAAAAARAFPRGGVEAVAFYTRWADLKMLAALERQDLDKMKVRERVAAGVRMRIEQNAPHREAIRRALAVLAMPQHAALGLRSLYDTVNAIWYAAGDTATDFNFYTKRGLLAAVYGATLLHWLNDDSEDFAATWSFLDRRLDDVMQIPRLTGRLRRLAGAFPAPLRPPRAPRRENRL